MLSLADAGGVSGRERFGLVQPKEQTDRYPMSLLFTTGLRE
jgi:hypothetical protein